MAESDVSFDPERSWRSLDARIDQEQDPRCRALLEEVREHIRTEVRGQLGPLMNTLEPNPVYHFWGLMGSGGGPKNRAEVEEFYTGMIASGGTNFELDIRRIVADADAVVTEGVMRQPILGSIVKASGVEEVQGLPVDPDATYLTESQVLTVWPAGADGKLKGEDIYMGSSPMSCLVRLPDSDG
jgi:hypothetical protein